MFVHLEFILLLLVISHSEAAKGSAQQNFPFSPSVKSITPVTNNLVENLKNNSSHVTPRRGTTKFKLLSTSTTEFTTTEPTTTEPTSTECTTETTTELTTTVETTTDMTAMEITTEKTTIESTTSETTLEDTSPTQLTSIENILNLKKAPLKAPVKNISDAVKSDNEPKSNTLKEKEILITTTVGLDSDISLATQEVTTNSYPKTEILNDESSHSEKINSYDSSDIYDSNKPSYDSYVEPKTAEYSSNSNIPNDNLNSNTNGAHHSNMSESYATETSGYDIFSENNSTSNVSVKIDIDIDISVSLTADNSTLKPEFPRRRGSTKKMVAGIILIILISVSAMSAVLFVMMPSRQRLPSFRRGHRSQDRLELISGRGRCRPMYKYYDATLYMRR